VRSNTNLGKAFSFVSGSKRGLSVVGMMMALGLSGAGIGCSGDGWSPADEVSDESAAFDAIGEGEGSDELASSSDEAPADGEMELGTAQQELFFSSFSSFFNFKSSCSDPSGTNSAMAALAVATATELKRWQPTKDFAVSNGMLQLTSTGKSRCADGKCWNTQALLDLQKAPTLTVEMRPGVKLDTKAFKSGLTLNLTFQLFSLLSMLVPDHKFELMHSEVGGCDQFYWFNVTSPTGGAVSSLLTSTLKQKLTWVGGSNNPYIQFQSEGTMVGIDPTYGLNQAGATAAGSCTAACTKMSSTDITGSCCSCNGTKKFARSTWNATTYICK
jgi:hypothetical protein